MDSFARDGLPPREQWPDLLLLDYPERLNAAEELLKHEGTAIAGGWSYAELAERADAVAGSLNIEPGERVLLHSPNTPEAIACWLGILLAGGIVVATMPLLRAREIDKVVAKANVTKALVARDLAGEVHVMDVRVIEDLPTRGWFDACDTAADDVAIIAFTSGTTGEPKGCVHFHRDLLASCETFARHVLNPQTDGRLQRLAADRVHVRARRLAVVPALLRRVHGADFAAAAARHAAGAAGDDAVHGADRVPRAAQGGPAGLAAHVRVRGRTAPGGRVGCVVREDRHPDRGRDRLDRDAAHLHRLARATRPRPGSCGRPVPGYEARIVDDAMETLAPGEVGKLAVRGPTGCRYLDDERQSKYVRDGLEPHRRRVLDGRGRLLLVPGAHRRHDHQLGVQHQRLRGRDRAARAPARAGVPPWSACPTRRAGTS